MLERAYPLIDKTSSYWLEREKAGKACTMWFTNPDALVHHVFDNIPAWKAKSSDFVLKSVKLKNSLQIKDKLKPDQERKDMYQGDWYYFREVEYGKWILRGMYIRHFQFSKKNLRTLFIDIFDYFLSISKR